MGNPKSLGPKVLERLAKESSSRKQGNAKKSMKKGCNKIGKKVFGKNTKKGSQKQLEHPLTLEVPLHGEHFVYYILHGKKKQTQNFNVI